MLLGLSDDQEFFRATTEHFSVRRVPPDTLPRSAATRPGSPGLLAPRRRAGVDVVAGARGARQRVDTGAGLVDLSLVAYEFGRHAAPGPLLAADVVASTLSRRMAPPPICWPACCPGRSSHRGAPPPWDPTGGGRRCRPAGMGPASSSAARPAWWSRANRRTTSSSRAATTPVSPRISSRWPRPASAGPPCRPPTSPGVSVSSRSTTPRSLLPPSSGRRSGGADVDRQFQLSLVLLDAESVGAMQAGFDMTVEWAFDRYSFGRPLASYQALKHRFADMFVWLEASHAIGDAACAATGEGADEAAELLSAAKAYIGQYGTGSCRTACRSTGASASPSSTTSTCTCGASPSTAPWPGRRPNIASTSRHCSTLVTRKRHERVAEEKKGEGEVEDLETFRRRARAFVQANLRTGRPRPLIWHGTGDKEAELAGIAHEREIQRVLFDAGWRESASPRLRGPGPDAGAPEGAERGARGHEYPARLQMPTLSPCAAVMLEFGSEGRSSATSPPSCGARSCGCSSSPSRAAVQTSPAP